MLRTQSAQKIMQQFGTSYYYATLFFPEDIKRDVFTLYKFVRVADEIVDDCQGDKLDIHYQNAAQELSDLRNNFFAALDRQDIQEVNFWPMVELTIRRNIPRQWIHDFLDAMLMDTYTSTYESYEKLQKYMYGSAEVIGLMMCHIVWADAALHPRACLLWEAMQYTNFLRDVYEDCVEYGRIYMPIDRLTAHQLTAHDVHDFCRTKKIDKRRIDFCRTEIDFCRWVYQEAETAISSLPANAQFAVLLASRLYQGILDKIESIEYNQFAQSARTGKVQKWRIISKAVAHRYITSHCHD